MKFEIKGLDEFQRHLERMQRDIRTTATRLNQTVVETLLCRDEDGFLDRRCPNCSFVFKVAGESPSESVKVCPSCGHNDPAARWETAAQHERAMANARAHAECAVKVAFSGARSPSFGVHPSFGNLTPELPDLWRRSQGIVNFRAASAAGSGVNVMREGNWVVVGVPAESTTALRSQRSCPDCGCHFSFVGSAFFCPCCGVAPAEENFTQSIIAIRSSITHIKSLSNALSADDAANLERALLEKAMADLVTGFQLLGEILYERLTGACAPENAFQRLDGVNSGNALWCSATGRKYSDYIGDDGMTALRRYFQRRHLLAHKNGFVDQSYLDRTGDRGYARGQRLVIRGSDVAEFIQIVELLASAMREHVSEAKGGILDAD